MKSLFRLFFLSFFPKQHLLILFQNNHELRATGGFITSVMDIHAGRVRFRKVFDELDHHKSVPGPVPLMKMLTDGRLKSWTLRDANFSPDFVQSSQKIIDFYQMVFPHHQVCGVVFLNFSVIEEVLSILGPVSISQKHLEAHELFHYLSAQVSDIDRHDHKSLTNRKNILRILAKKTLLKGLIRFWKAPQLIRCISRKLRERELQVYDERSKSTFFPQSLEEDFLSVIDSNFLGLKSNRYIRRNIFHDTQIDLKGERTNTVRILWEHFGAEDRPLSGTYRAYVRIYIPKRSSKINFFSSPDVGTYKKSTEKTCRVLGFELVLPPQSKTMINIQFLVPSQELTNYQFRCFKQSGAGRDSFQKSVTHPHYRTLLPANTGQVSEQVFTDGRIPFQEDYTLNLTAEDSLHPPRILFHEVISPKKILIRFSEPMDFSRSLSRRIHIKDKYGRKNYTITRFQKRNNNTELILHVPKLPQEEERFYVIQVDDLQSQRKIFLSPRMRRITVVYRSKYFSH